MNQVPLLIKGWPQCLHSSLRSMGRSRVESDITLLPHRAGARVCLSAIGAVNRSSDDAYHPTPKMCTARWSPGRVASLRLRTHTRPPEAGHKDCPKRRGCLWTCNPEALPCGGHCGSPDAQGRRTVYLRIYATCRLSYHHPALIAPCPNSFERRAASHMAAAKGTGAMPWRSECCARSWSSRRHLATSGQRFVCALMETS